MTHYHIYIAAGSVIDETTRIYYVGIGTSRQANRDYLALVAHAVDHNHFFHIVDAETLQFMHKVINSVSTVNLSPLQVSARQLRKSFAASEDIPLASGTLHNRHRSRSILDMAYRITNAIASKRK